MIITIDLPPDKRAEITEENIVTIPPGIYPIWSPYDTFEAADTLMASLMAEERRVSVEEKPLRG